MRVYLKSLGQGAWLIGPLAVCLSSILLVAHATRRPISIPGVILFFFGVLSTYTLDHWADQPTARSPKLLHTALLAAFVVAISALGLPFWKIALAVVLGLAGLAYRWGKKLPLGKTLLVAGGWSAAALAFPVQWDARDLFPAPLDGALLALFAANALLCDLKDGPADAQSGVPTAVVLWGQRAARLIATALAGGGMVLALATQRLGLAAAGLALMTLSAFPKVVSRPVLGPALVDAALTLPAALILAGWA